MYVLLGLFTVALAEIPHGISGTYLVAMPIKEVVVFSGDSLGQMLQTAPAFAAACAVHALPFALLRRQMRHR